MKQLTILKDPFDTSESIQKCKCAAKKTKKMGSILILHGLRVELIAIGFGGSEAHY